MRTEAVIFEEPGRLVLAATGLVDPGTSDAVVAVAASGVSTGTEKLLWQGRMPAFPGMGYPLVPGYEAVGEVVEAGAASGWRVGDRVFAPGATCFAEARALFGAAAATLVVPGARLVRDPVGDERGILLALAATAHHAVAGGLPDLIVGHGTLGRLVARLTLALGGAPVVWECDQARRSGGGGAYPVVDAAGDPRRDYPRILDASGAAGILDALVSRLARDGEVVLAGFYPGQVAFAFAPAFLREARLRVVAEWTPADMAATVALVESGRLSLDGLVTDRLPARDAAAAYRRAFEAPDCLKMTLDWSH